jgi:hypothetical protein
MQRAGIDWRSYTQPRVGHMQPYDDD